MTLALIQRGGPSVVTWCSPMPVRADGGEDAPGLWPDAVEALGRRATIVGHNAHGKETFGDVLAYAGSAGGLRRAELCALTAFSAGCQRVREWFLAGARARAYALVDGLHASRPIEAWQMEYGRALVDGARRGDHTLVVSHGYITPTGYTSIVDYLRALTGMELPAPSPGTLVKRPPQGGLHVYSYGGADPVSHLWQGRNVPRIIFRDHLASLLRPGDDLGEPAQEARAAIYSEGRWIDLEAEYVPRVVSGELPQSAPPEAQRAQAVAARTYLLRAMRDNPRLGTPSRPVPSSERFQVMGKVATPQAIQATQATRGQVITWQGELIFANYVAGAPVRYDATAPHSVSFGADPTNTQRYVTINTGLRADEVHKSSIASPRPANRGCMSQNLAMFLARTVNADHLTILRYFYGEDIELRNALRRDRAVSSPALRAVAGPAGAFLFGAVAVAAYAMMGQKT